MNFTDLLFLAEAAAAPAAGAEQPPMYMMLIQFVPIIVIFYFLLIRPQQKRQKDHQKLMAAIKTGDKVITSSGIHGIIANVKDKTVIVKVADNVKLEFDRASITAVEKSELPVAEVK